MNPSSQSWAEFEPPFSSNPTKRYAPFQRGLLPIINAARVYIHTRIISIESKSTNTSAHSPPGTSAFLARARILALHLEFQAAPPLSSFPPHSRSADGKERHFSRRNCSHPATRASSLLAQLSSSAMRAKLMSCISCSDFPHDDAGRL